MYMALKFNGYWSCRIHIVSDGDREIVTNERYVVMPCKMVNVNGKRVRLKRQLMRYLVTKMH